MEQKDRCVANARRSTKFPGLALLSLLITGSIFAIAAVQAKTGRDPLTLDRYYLRVAGCDDGGRAYLDDKLIVDVGFDEDSNWLDITEDVARGKDEIRFEVVNRTGAITYLFQVRKNETVIFEQACGKAKELGCENNRAFRVGTARKFTYTVRKDE